MISPFTRRNINKILFFSTAWAFSGFVYVIIEKGLMGRANLYPSTGGLYDYKTNLMIITLGAFIFGVFHGVIEVLYLANKFRKRSFTVKTLVKTVIYISFCILFLVLMTMITNSNLHDKPIYSKEVLESVKKFMFTFAFWSVIIYTGVVLDLIVLLNELSDNLGQGVFSNYIFGKYHQPKEEERIFMFLDMKSSTSIAEHIGHKKYFDFLNDFYADITPSIINYFGEIYQYVGDEVVVSWNLKHGLRKDNCIKCFFSIQNELEVKKQNYLDKYGYKPDFKAGFHLGKVIIGEIGTIKKDIVYSGDVLNTTARIQSLCNKYKASILISEVLFSKLSDAIKVMFLEIGESHLRGKETVIKLYAIKKALM